MVEKCSDFGDLSDNNVYIHVDQYIDMTECVYVTMDMFIVIKVNRIVSTLRSYYLLVEDGHCYRTAEWCYYRCK